ncbi:kynurenine/alpha-aminoadipate aminotransferase, mitochondrial [Spodoptera litura]|uniref:Kynurenine/alpha-aminoadipate aminotransferase, mitochondrial n=1 Tax=Spodoptera litura TaxID=69820 RepID=A0A9J7EX60_SPOLT|nr:kynurenine/alpha-aminoadipate aminotransferase, mitochondrial [Spodoptera litura]
MFVTTKLRKVNRELAKRLFEARAVTLILKKDFSQRDVDVNEFFKFYNENSYQEDRYKPLTEQDYDRYLSTRAARREPALTRQITSLAYKVGKEMISLAEGMPNEQVFPFTRLSMDTKFSSLVLEGKDLAAALQYVPSQGLPALLSELRKFQSETHRAPEVPRDVLVTNGGQHGIYQCVELLVEPGDPVITCEYAYTGIHSTLKPYQPEIIGIPEDEDGMIPETLDAVLGERLRRGLKMPKMMYIIPTGSNPTGTVLPEERRRQIYELACRYDFLIVEDDPYMFLNYTDRPIPSFLSMDTCGRVLRLDSVSKVVSAGLRGAWITAPKPLLQRLELHTQAELLHSCTLAQAILLQLVQCRKSLASHLTNARDFYRERRDALHAALKPVEHLAPYSMPDAGLFFWLRVNGVDDVYNMVFHTAFQRGLMLVPGQAFLYDSNAPCPYLRLTFSKIRHEDMDKAVSNLVEIIREEQQRTLQKPKRVATEG